MIAFNNIKQLSYDETTFPITLADVKFQSKWFQENPNDTSLDDYINNDVIPVVISEFEKETGFLIQDQTYKATIPNLQSPIYNTFKAQLIHLNVSSVNDVLYYPCEWNGSDAKTILATENYNWLNEEGDTSKIFELKACYLNFYEIPNNFEVSYRGGYLNNDFTNIPKNLKRGLAKYAADLIDVRQELCDCNSIYREFVNSICRQYRRYTDLI